ncbi:uncharacterized protein BJ171DRAFT_598273, partial [Polychytrium aggregatum]|uniref:uncharacterized protein n=1 Tax=Polychytrium aggregatum TaxID=110093 RepID=UPI0022FE5F25
CSSCPPTPHPSIARVCRPSAVRLSRFPPEDCSRHGRLQAHFALGPRPAAGGGPRSPSPSPDSSSLQLGSPRSSSPSSSHQLQRSASHLHVDPALVDNVAGAVVVFGADLDYYNLLQPFCCCHFPELSDRHILQPLRLAHGLWHSFSIGHPNHRPGPKQRWGRHHHRPRRRRKLCRRRRPRHLHLPKVEAQALRLVPRSHQSQLCCQPGAVPSGAARRPGRQHQAACRAVLGNRLHLLAPAQRQQPRAATSWRLCPVGPSRLQLWWPHRPSSEPLQRSLRPTPAAAAAAVFQLRIRHQLQPRTVTESVHPAVLICRRLRTLPPLQPRSYTEDNCRFHPVVRAAGLD